MSDWVHVWTEQVNGLENSQRASGRVDAISVLSLALSTQVPPFAQIKKSICKRCECISDGHSLNVCSICVRATLDNVQTFPEFIREIGFRWSCFSNIEGLPEQGRRDIHDTWPKQDREAPALSHPQMFGCRSLQNSSRHLKPMVCIPKYHEVLCFSGQVMKHMLTGYSTDRGHIHETNKYRI